MKNKKEETELNNSKDPDRYVTRGVFREMCGYNGEPLPYQTVATDVRRGNIIEEEDRTIDIENPINAEYIKNRQQFQMEKTVKADPKKSIELKKAQQDLKIKELKYQQMRGEVIPKKLVYETVKAHFKQTHQQYFFGCQQIMVDMARQLGATKEQVAELKGKMVTVVNDIIERGRENTMASVDEISEEYSKDTAA